MALPVAAPQYIPNNYCTVLPKGIIEISINLKCCFANGIPMMVMVNSKPKNICISAVYSPPLNNHTIFAKMVRQPVSLELLTIFLPNGHSTSPASLKHCRPQGMPTTVIHKIMPPHK